MTHEEFKEAINTLNQNAWELEFQYQENGGEVTPETEALEATTNAVRELLTTEGADYLGRWLKAKQDEIAAAKAEKAAADRRLKSLQMTEEFIKGQISRLMVVTETDNIKGQYYTFTRTRSIKTEVLTDALDDAFLEAATEGARNAGLPSYVDVALKTNVSRIREYAEANGEEGSEFLLDNESDSVRFTKPRSVKE